MIRVWRTADVWHAASDDPYVGAISGTFEIAAGFVKDALSPEAPEAVSDIALLPERANHNVREAAGQPV